MRTLIALFAALAACHSCPAQDKEDYELVSGRLTDIGFRNGYLHVALNGKIMKGLSKDDVRILPYSDEGKKAYMTPYDVPNAVRKNPKYRYAWLAVSKKTGKWKYLILGHDIEVPFDASNFPLPQLPARPQMSARPPLPPADTYLDGDSPNGSIGKLAGRVMQIIDGNTCMITQGGDQPFMVRGAPTAGMRVNLRENTKELNAYVLKVLGNKQYTGVNGAIKTATLVEPVTGKELADYRTKVKERLDQNNARLNEWSKQDAAKLNEWSKQCDAMLADRDKALDAAKKEADKKNGQLRSEVASLLFEKNAARQVAKNAADDLRATENEAAAEKDAKTLLDLARQSFNANDKPRARKQLEAINKKYPKTKAAAEAQKLLKILDG